MADEELTPSERKHYNHLQHFVNTVRSMCINYGLVNITQTSTTKLLTALESNLQKREQSEPLSWQTNIAKALAESRGSDQQRIATKGVEWLTTLLAKNSDYGSSAWKVPKLVPNLPPKQAILVRMSDKIERIESLQKKGAAEVKESFDDTIGDLGSYCLLYLICPGEDDAEEENEIDY